MELSNSKIIIEGELMISSSNTKSKSLFSSKSKSPYDWKLRYIIIKTNELNKIILEIYKIKNSITLKKPYEKYDLISTEIKLIIDDNISNVSPLHQYIFQIISLPFVLYFSSDEITRDKWITTLTNNNNKIDKKEEIKNYINISSSIPEISGNEHIENNVDSIITNIPIVNQNPILNYHSPNSKHKNRKHKSKSSEKKNIIIRTPERKIEIVDTELDLDTTTTNNNNNQDLDIENEIEKIEKEMEKEDDNNIPLAFDSSINITNDDTNVVIDIQVESYEKDIQINDTTTTSTRDAILVIDDINEFKTSDDEVKNSNIISNIELNVEDKNSNEILDNDTNETIEVNLSNEIVEIDLKEKNDSNNIDEDEDINNKLNEVVSTPIELNVIEENNYSNKNTTILEIANNEIESKENIDKDVHNSVEVNKEFQENHSDSIINNENKISNNSDKDHNNRRRNVFEKRLKSSHISQEITEPKRREVRNSTNDPLENGNFIIPSLPLPQDLFTSKEEVLLELIPISDISTTTTAPFPIPRLSHCQTKQLYPPSESNQLNSPTEKDLSNVSSDSFMNESSSLNISPDKSAGSINSIDNKILDQTIISKNSLGTKPIQSSFISINMTKPSTPLPTMQRATRFFSPSPDIKSTLPISLNEERLIKEMEIVVGMNGQLNDLLEKSEFQLIQEQESFLLRLSNLQNQCDTFQKENIKLEEICKTSQNNYKELKLKKEDYCERALHAEAEIKALKEEMLNLSIINNKDNISLNNSNISQENNEIVNSSLIDDENNINELCIIGMKMTANPDEVIEKEDDCYSTDSDFVNDNNNNNNNDDSFVSPNKMNHTSPKASTHSSPQYTADMEYLQNNSKEYFDSLPESDRINILNNQLSTIELEITSKLNEKFAIDLSAAASHILKVENFNSQLNKDIEILKKSSKPLENIVNEQRILITDFGTALGDAGINRSKLASSNETIIELSVALEDLTAKYRDIELELSSLHYESDETLSLTKSTLTKELDNLKSSYSHLELELNTSQMNSAALSAEIINLRSTIRDKEITYFRDIENVKQELRQYSNEKSQLESQIELLNQRLESNKHKIYQLENELSEVQNRRIIEKSNFQKIQSENHESLETSARNLRSLYVRLDDVNTNHAAEIQRLSSEIQGLQNELLMYETSISSLRSRLVLLEEHREKDTKVIMEEKMVNNKLNEDLLLSETECKSLYERFNEKNNILDQSNSEKKRIIFNLKQELTDLIYNKNEDKRKFELIISDLEKSIEPLEIVNNKLENKIDDLSKSMDDSIADTEIITTKYTKLLNESNELNQKEIYQKDNYKKNNLLLNEEIKLLNISMSSFSKEMEEKDGNHKLEIQHLHNLVADGENKLKLEIEKSNNFDNLLNEKNQLLKTMEVKISDLLLEENVSIQMLEEEECIVNNLKENLTLLQQNYDINSIELKAVKIELSNINDKFNSTQTSLLKEKSLTSNLTEHISKLELEIINNNSKMINLEQFLTSSIVESGDLIRKINELLLANNDLENQLNILKINLRNSHDLAQTTISALKIEQNGYESIINEKDNELFIEKKKLQEFLKNIARDFFGELNDRKAKKNSISIDTAEDLLLLALGGGSSSRSDVMDNLTKDDDDIEKDDNIVDSIVTDDSILPSNVNTLGDITSLSLALSGLKNAVIDMWSFIKSHRMKSEQNNKEITPIDTNASINSITSSVQQLLLDSIIQLDVCFQSDDKKIANLSHALDKDNKKLKTYKESIESLNGNYIVLQDKYDNLIIEKEDNESKSTEEISMLQEELNQYIKESDELQDEHTRTIISINVTAEESILKNTLHLNKQLEESVKQETVIYYFI
jgi:chromosome segregation ATPase